MIGNSAASIEKMLSDIWPVIDFYKKSGVAGMILYGGYGRGEQLSYSDVDIGIICENKETLKALELEFDKNWQIKDYFVEPTLYDYGYLSTQPLPERIMRDFSLFWTEDNRFNWQQSKILYDPSGRVQQLIDTKAILPRAEARATRDVLALVISRSLNYHLPRFIEAGKYAEAQMLMNRLIGRIIHYVYCSNDLLMPPESTAFYWFSKKELPGKKSIEQLFDNCEAVKEPCEKRIESFWRVCQELNIKIEHQSPEEFLQYFFNMNGVEDFINQ